MFSVKYIRISGHEEIYPALRVSYHPKDTDPQELPACVFMDKPDGSTQQLLDGTIFVMNDMGKTVSRYDLGMTMVGFERNPILAPTA